MEVSQSPSPSSSTLRLIALTVNVTVTVTAANEEEDVFDVQYGSASLTAGLTGDKKQLEDSLRFD